MLQENTLLLKKIHGAEPTVQHIEHREHEKAIKKLKDLV
jgi:hypothetical protein